MQIVRYDPFSALKEMEKDLGKIWSDDWGLLPAFNGTSAMDLYEEDGNLVAEVSLPNYKKEEIKINVSGGVLEVSAEHKEEEEKKGKRRYFFRESSSQYLRRVPLPEGVEGDKADASFKDGVLKVVMPIKERPESKHIAIK